MRRLHPSDPAARVGVACLDLEQQAGSAAIGEGALNRRWRRGRINEVGPPPHRDSPASAYLVTVAAALALPAAALVSSPLLARALGAEGRGVMAAIIAPAALATLVAPAGFPEALSFFTARLGLSRALLARAFIAAVVLGGASTVVLWLGAPLLLQKIPGNSAVFLFIALTVPLALLQSNLRGIAQGSGAWRLVVHERWLSIGLRLLPLVVLFLLGYLDLLLAVAVTWGSGLLAGLVYLPLALRTATSKVRAERQHIVSYALRVWASSLSGVVVLRLDQLILAVSVSPVQLGWYVIAVAIAEVPQTGAGAIQQLVLARTAGGADLVAIARTARIAVALSTFLVVLAMVSAPALIGAVFGADFEGSVPIAEVLLLATIPLALSTVLTGGLMGLGRPGVVGLARALAALLTIGLLVLLVPTLGATGAALASLVTYTLLAVALLAIMMRTNDVSSRSFLLVSREDLRFLKQTAAGRLPRRRARQD